MHLSTLVIAAAAAVAPVSAFTNGTLVPSYICNPTPDGKPKTFGQLLQLVKKNVQTVGFDGNTGDNVKAKNAAAPQGTNLPNSAYILASFHNSPNKVTTIQQAITVKTANGGPIKAGQANQLTLTTGNANVALGGVLLYANDQQGNRQGTFSDQSGKNTFVPFPGCGLNQQNQVSGVIQQTGVSGNGTFSQLFYNAPANLGGNVTIAGLSVTANGFGVWTYSFAVTGGTGGNAGGNTGGNKGGNGGTTGGNKGTTTGGNGGNTGGNKGTTTGGNQGGNKGTTTGGNGGNTGGNQGGNTGGNQGGNTGGNQGGNTGGNKGTTTGGKGRPKKGKTGGPLPCANFRAGSKA